MRRSLGDEMRGDGMASGVWGEVNGSHGGLAPHATAMNGSANDFGALEQVRVAWDRGPCREL